MPDVTKPVSEVPARLVIAVLPAFDPSTIPTVAPLIAAPVVDVTLPLGVNVASIVVVVVVVEPVGPCESGFMQAGLVSAMSARTSRTRRT